MQRIKLDKSKGASSYQGSLLGGGESRHFKKRKKSRDMGRSVPLTAPVKTVKEN